MTVDHQTAEIVEQGGRVWLSTDTPADIRHRCRTAALLRRHPR